MKYAPPIGQEAQGESAHYIDGNPELGILGSPVPAAAIEPCQRELVHVIRQAGLTPSAEDMTQLYQAICKIIGAQVPLASKTAPGLMQVGAGLIVTEEGLVAVENKAASLLTCATAGAVAVKEVEIEGFSLAPGARLDVIFSEVNSAVTPMLSVNEGISKPLRWQGVAPEVGDLAKGQIYEIIYSGTDWQILAGMAPWRIGQYERWQDDLPRESFAPLNGAVIEDVSERYPQIMVYLNTTHGLKRRFTTLAEYDAAHVATWHTLASGATVGWDGLGGVCKFYYDATADKLYLPDLVGMFECVAGDGIVAPSMGVAMGDRARDIVGSINLLRLATQAILTGAFYFTGTTSSLASSGTSLTTADLGFHGARVMPTGTTNSPRGWGALACAYFGQPATS